jgi:hypothetical protein
MGQWQPMVEQLHPEVSAEKARICIFDFDGMIRLLMQVMFADG